MVNSKSVKICFAAQFQSQQIKSKQISSFFSRHKTEKSSRIKATRNVKYANWIDGTNDTHTKRTQLFHLIKITGLKNEMRLTNCSQHTITKQMWEKWTETNNDECIFHTHLRPMKSMIGLLKTPQTPLYEYSIVSTACKIIIYLLITSFWNLFDFRSWKIETTGQQRIPIL